MEAGTGDYTNEATDCERNGSADIEGWRGTEDWEHYSEGTVQEILNQCGILLILNLEQDLWRIIFKITKIIMLNCVTFSNYKRLLFT